MKPRKLSAHYLLLEGKIEKGGVVTVDADGTITGIDFPDNIDRLQGVEFFDGILIPGIFNSHCHLELSYLKGAIPRGTGFPGFARAIAENRGKFHDDTMTGAAAFYDSRMWNRGVSVCLDISNSFLSFGLKSKSALAYYTFAEAYGLGRVDIAKEEALLAGARAQGLWCEISPHSLYSLNEDFLRLSVKHSRVLSIHFMESPGEKELYGKRGEMYEWYREKGFPTDFIGKYKSPAERIVKNIESEKRIFLVHNTFITEEDIDLLNGHFGENVTYVICPRSNKYISDSLPPVELMRRKRCRIAVGTDSLASNEDLDPAAEIACFPGVPLHEKLAWLTANPALALGVYEGFGRIAVGSAPGIAVLSGWENADGGSRIKSQRII